MILLDANGSLPIGATHASKVSDGGILSIPSARESVAERWS
jgi:hypothetical protein